MAIALATGLAACGGGSGSSDSQLPAVKSTISVPNSSKPKFSFDISYAASGRYYLTDRNNAAVDVVDTHSNTLVAQIKSSKFPFTGGATSLSTSGPNGLVGIPKTNVLYASDVNEVKVIDTSALQVVGTIPISTSGNRVDAGCYDPDDDIVMFASPSDNPPFVTFISNRTRTVLNQSLTFPAATGLEACVYDSKSKQFLLNNDGPAGGSGELDVIPAASVVSGAPTVSANYPLGNCGPTGLALGPNNDLLIGCDPAAGQRLTSLILDRSTGTTLGTIPFGGVDQVAYDPATNRYFMPARHATASGIAADSGFTPLVGVVDAGTRKLIAQVPVGAGVHSVAIDDDTDQVYVPFQPGEAAFPNGGILVMSAH